MMSSISDIEIHFANWRYFFFWKFIFSSWILFEFRNTKFFHILLRLFFNYFCLSIFWRSFYTKILDIRKAIDIETCLLGLLHLTVTLKKLEFLRFISVFIIIHYHYSFLIYFSTERILWLNFLSNGKVFFRYFYES
jgi:hypothetical protein